MPSSVCRALIAALCLPLSAFFGFVGWNKAFASLDDLVRYGSWTVHLPDIAGRIVGWSEMACAAGLLAFIVKGQAGVVRSSALVLVVNQLVAAVIHWNSDEAAALPQNGVLIALLVLVIVLSRKCAEKEAPLP